MPPRRILSEETRWLIYLVAGLALMILAVILLIMSIGYMQSALVATSLLTALIGFTLLSGSLYILKISAYVYSASRGRESSGEKRE